MRCAEARPLISAAIDHELEAGQAASLRRHLSECHSCSTEYAVVAATARLLHAVPEVEPPVQLRQRIDAALLELERGAERRVWLPLWLSRPRTAGWAWGAALGTAAATAVLVMSRGPAPTTRGTHLTPQRPAAVAAQPTLLRPRSVYVTAKDLSHPARPAEGAGERLAHPASPLKPPVVAEKPPASAVETLSGTLAPAMPPVTVRHSVESASTKAAVLSPRLRRSARHLRVQVSPHAPSLQPSMPHATSSPHPESSSDGMAKLASKTTPSLSTQTSPDQPPDEGSTPDTSGMVHMASRAPMTAAPTEEPDDLSALRQRLMDRPLQAPELGQLKPAPSSGGSHDGWIRF